MKIISAVLLFIIICKQGHTQTYDEMFRQKKTQKKYLLEQIAALQTYIGYAQKGYSLATKGLNTIQDIKHGDYTLHHNFFTSLTAVNPRIKTYSKVAAIVAMQISIASHIHAVIKDCKKAKQLTSAELDYLQQVFNNLLDDCGKNLDELIALITDGGQQMKDDERIKRIDKLYVDMQDKQVFAQSFSHSAKGLSVQRRKDKYDIEIIKKINGLK